MKLYCSSTANPCWIKIKVLFIKLAAVLATELGHNSKPYNKQLCKLRYAGVMTDTTPLMIEARQGQDHNGKCGASAGLTVRRLPVLP